jgi:hypothetical protein
MNLASESSPLHLSFHQLFLQCLAESLPQGGGVLSLAMPGNPFAALLRRPDLDLDVSDALSADFLARYAGFTESLTARPNTKPVVAASDGDLRLGDTCAFGAGFATTAPRHFRTQSLSGLIAGMRDPALLYLDCDADAGGLLASAIDAILKRGTIVWLECRAQTRESFLERLYNACATDAFDLFGLDYQSGCVDLRQQEPQQVQQLQGVLLVPKWRWNCHGLAHLAKAATIAEQAADLRVPLLVTRSRGVSERTLGILSSVRAVPAVPTVPAKVFLPAARHVFGRHARLEPIQHEEDTFGLSTQGLHKVRLAFVPPMAGKFDLCVLLAWPPKADLQMRIGNLRVPMHWNEEWFHLKGQVHLMATQANRPFIFDLSRTGGTSELGLMVKGIELDYIEQPATGTLFPVRQI